MCKSLVIKTFEIGNLMIFHVINWAFWYNLCTSTLRHPFPKLSNWAGHLGACHHSVLYSNSSLSWREDASPLCFENGWNQSWPQEFPSSAPYGRLKFCVPACWSTWLGWTLRIWSTCVGTNQPLSIPVHLVFFLTEQPTETEWAVPSTFPLTTNKSLRLWTKKYESSTVKRHTHIPPPPPPPSPDIFPRWDYKLLLWHSAFRPSFFTLSCVPTFFCLLTSPLPLHTDSSSSFMLLQFFPAPCS